MANQGQASGRSQNHRHPHKRDTLLSLLADSFYKYLGFPLAEADYQMIAEDYRQLTGAMFVIMNSYDESRRTTTTMAISGHEGQLGLLFQLLGGNPVGRSWPVDERSEMLHLSGTITEIPSLYDFACQRIPADTCRQIEELFQIGKIYGIGMASQDRILGNVGLIMPRGRHLEEQDLVEILTCFVSGLLLRRNVEMTLRETREHYQHLVEHLPDALIISHDNRIAFANRTAADLLGARDPQQLLGMEVLSFVHHDYVEFVKARMQQVLERNEPVPLAEEKMLRLDGKTLTVEVVSLPFMHRDKRCIQTIVRDISKRKWLEAELLKAGKFQSFQQLASGIAHDFNNILAVIQGRITIGKLYAAGYPKLAASLDEIERAVKQATGLTNQLLTYAKGRVPRKSIVNLGEILRDSASLSLSGSGIQCAFRIAKDLWPVEIDISQINQVINNLVVNAVQAMPNGGIIKVRADNFVADERHLVPLLPGKYVRVSIMDEGVGIPEKYLSRIFDPYFTTKQNGNGLGLAMAYSIITKHNGYITVESKEGAGTVFRIFLPAAEGAKDQVAANGEKNGLRPGH